MSTLAASAHSEGAKLTYTRSANASACPDEAALREAVAQKVGRDPFDGEDAYVDVHIERSAGELVGSVEVREGSVVRGTRTLSSKSASCDELVSALVVTISIALDPARFGVPPRPAPPPPARTPTPMSTSSTDEPPREDLAPSSSPSKEQKTGAGWQIGAGAGAAFGVAPSPAASLHLSFGARWERASLDVEGRVYLPASDAVAGGSVSTSSSIAAVVPCFHAGPVALCAVGALGVIRGEGRGVRLPSTDSSFAAAAGARLAVEVPLHPSFGLRAGVDGMATIHGARLMLDGREAWSTPSLWFSSWGGVVVHFR